MPQAMRHTARMLVVSAMTTALIWSSPVTASAATSFCHGYTTYTDTHSGAIVHFKTCITYFINGANYDVQATTYAYLTNYSGTHINTLQIGAKLETPLGTVKNSNGCSFSPPIGSANARSCMVQRSGVVSPGQYFSTGRTTAFYSDGHSAALGPKLCQTGVGPNNSPGGFC